MLTVLTAAGEANMTLAYERYVELAAERFREELMAVVAEQERAGLAPRNVLGDPGEFAERAVHTLVPVPSPWDAIAGPFVQTEGVQARLGISRQAVAAKAARRRLLRVVTADDVHLYPLWQFEGTGLVHGLPDVLALFPEQAVDGWTLAAWLRTPEPELGEAPLDLLARGEVETVLTVARSAATALGG
jgi:hypothetical protein